MMFLVPGENLEFLIFDLKLMKDLVLLNAKTEFCQVNIIKIYQGSQKLEFTSSSEFLKNSSEWVLSEFSSSELRNLDQVRDLSVSSGQDIARTSPEGALGGWSRDKNIKSQYRLANNQREYPLIGRFETKTKGSNSKIANCRMFDEGVSSFCLVC